MLMIPLRGYEFDNGIFGLLKTVTRLSNDKLMYLGNICRGKMRLLIIAMIRHANHARQCCLDIKQRTCDIHERRIGTGHIPSGQRRDLINLIQNNATRLAKAQDSQRVCNLLQGKQQCAQLARLLTVATYIQIKAVLDAHQLFA